MCIDGNMFQAREGYLKGIDGVRNWCQEGGIVVDVSDLFGPRRVVCTTRAGGALDLELKYNGRSLTFLIQGRNLYVRGWRGRGKTFELEYGNQEENFTLDRNCIRLKYGVNYNELISGGAGEVPTGLFLLRKAFDRMWRFSGGEKIGISEDVAIMAVHISEATRYPYISRYISKSFIHQELSKLGHDPTNATYVKRYSKVSAYVMENIDRMQSGKEPLPIKIQGLEDKTMDDLVNDIGILFRDGYNGPDSKFEHEDRPSPPIFENTMVDIIGPVKKKRMHHQKERNQKSPKGKGGPKGGGGSMGEGKQSDVGSIGGGKWAPGGRKRPDGGSVGGGRGHGGSPTSFHIARRGPKGGLARPPYTGAGLRDLLDDTPSFSMAFTPVGLKAINACHYNPLCSSRTHNQSLNMFVPREMWMPPSTPIPNSRINHSFLDFSPSFMRQKYQLIRPLPPQPEILQGTASLCRSTLSGILKPRFITRALKLVR